MSDRAALDSKLGDLAREFAPALPSDPGWRATPICTKRG